MNEATFNRVVELNDKLEQLESLQDALQTASLELRHPSGALVKMSKIDYCKNLLNHYTEMMQQAIEADIETIKQQIDAL